MKAFNVLKKVTAIRMAVGMILLGLIFVGLSCFLLAQPEKETNKVEATITDISESVFGADSEHRVTVSYEIDGKTYENELGAYVSTWKVGDTLNCTYNLDDPNVISYGSTKGIVIIILIVGVAAVAVGVVFLVINIRKKTAQYAQYNRIDESNIDPLKKEEVERSIEGPQNYVFHFTGKLGQSYVMKDTLGNEVVSAECGQIRLLSDKDYTFVNRNTGSAVTRKIGHSYSIAYRGGLLFQSVSSGFRIDGQDCWDYLAERGYGFEFSMNGIYPHYEVKHYGVSVGYAEAAGSEILKKEYEGKAVAKVPANGMFRISCPPGETEGFFYICFCLSQTNKTLS